MSSFLFSALLWLVIFRAEPLVFRITTNLPAASGRLFVIISKSDRPEPRTTIGQTGMTAPPVLARDAKTFGPGSVASLDKTAVIFPLQNLDGLPDGDYYVQALFDSNVDLNSSVNAPGNRYSDVQRVHISPRSGGTVNLEI